MHSCFQLSGDLSVCFARKKGSCQEKSVLPMKFLFTFGCTTQSPDQMASLTTSRNFRIWKKEVGSSGMREKIVDCLKVRKTARRDRDLVRTLRKRPQ